MEFEWGQQKESKNAMSKITDKADMRPEYDFSAGVRGKHHQAYQQGTNVVLLDRDVAEVFKDAAAVNCALRMLLDLAGSEIRRNLTKGSSNQS